MSGPLATLGSMFLLLSAVMAMSYQVRFQNITSDLFVNKCSFIRQLGQSMDRQSSNFGQFRLNSRNLADMILHNSVFCSRYTMTPQSLLPTGCLQSQKEPRATHKSSHRQEVRPRLRVFLQPNWLHGLQGPGMGQKKWMVSLFTPFIHWSPLIWSTDIRSFGI